jgi:hypothetical protein
MSGDDYLRRFAFAPKVIGWWVWKNGWWGDDTGWPIWIVESISHHPIEMFHNAQGGCSPCLWSGWLTGQEVTFGIPWLIGEVNRRSGDRIAIDPETLEGKDDLGASVAVKVFDGRVTSKSGQVNWLGFKSSSGKYQLALINHAEATEVTAESELGTPVSATVFDAEGRRKAFKTPGADGRLKIAAKSMVVLAWR